MTYNKFWGNAHATFDLVVDIECVGPQPHELDPTLRRYLAERAQQKAKWQGEQLDDDEADERAMDRMALDLGLARVIAAGFRNVHERRSTILLENTGEAVGDLPDITVERHTESGMLNRAWQIIAHNKVRTLVTYNGRGYDGPVIMVRSAQLGVRVYRNLVPYRYNIKQHCDLQDVLGFFGSCRNTYTLDYWCRVFGIPSPKADGISGEDIERLYRAGAMGQIATYLSRDIQRTGDLYCAFGRAGFLEQIEGGPSVDWFDGLEDPDEEDDGELPFPPFGPTEAAEAAHRTPESVMLD